MRRIALPKVAGRIDPTALQSSNPESPELIALTQALLRLDPTTVPSSRSRSRELLAAGAVEVFPTVALFDDGFEVFLPDDRVLDGVFNDGAAEA